MRALVIGRFQPFHNGHKKLTETFKNYELIFAIGSAYKSLSFENPFTAGERYEMIYRALSELNLNTFFIIPIPDINRHGVYGKHIIDLSPPFDIVISNNVIIKEIFERENYKVIGTSLFNREMFQGKIVRKRIAENKKWETLVPKSTSIYIKEIGGDERIRRLGTI